MVRGFELLNDYYDQIYVVTIPRSFKEREMKITRNLEGLEYTLFWGIDGKEIPKETIGMIYNSEEARRKFSSYCKKNIILKLNGI